MHAADSEAIPVLTVCQALRDPARYDGQNVIVVGRFASTSEGGWLDEDCGIELARDGRKFRPSISTSYVASEFAPPPKMPKGFKWNREALKPALAEVKQTAPLDTASGWYAVYGRLETAPVRTVILSSGQKVIMNGYGHLNAAPAQIVANAHGWRKLR